MIIGRTESKQKIMNNGLPQGSMLASLIFNLYTYELLPDLLIHTRKLYNLDGTGINI